MPACTCPPREPDCRGPVNFNFRDEHEVEFFLERARAVAQLGARVTAEDSGIDSDSETRGRMREAFLNHGYDMDAESVFKSDEEGQSNADEDERRYSDHDFIEDSDHEPPLIEVVLTATDDDDDESVLELVIPMQQKKGQYRRVPKDERGELPPTQRRRRRFGWLSCCLFSKK